MHADSPLTIHTIGHSTRPLETFLGLLQEFGVRHLVDIRSFPGSRKYPHFNREPLERSVVEAGLAYTWLQALGGRRRSPKDAVSVNTGLRHPAFRAYADYMATSDFAAGIDALLRIARDASCAIMCSEAVYWRCHRRLVSDHLVLHAEQVLHIMEPGSLRPHRLTEGATLTLEGVVIYVGNGPGQHEPTLF